MKGEPRPARCWYCGEPCLRVGDPLEHIIPDALGGTLKTDRVCGACNQRAGREIDAPFMRDFLMAAERARYLPGKAKLPPRIAIEVGEDETPADLRLGGVWSARIRGALDRDGDSFSIRAADLAEYEKLLKRARTKAAEEGRTLEEPGEPHTVEANEVRVHARVEGVVWLRMAAKITLGALSKVLDEGWLDSGDAAKYRGWLWDETPTNTDGSKALGFPVPANELDRYANRPPKHLIYFARSRDDRVVCTIAYFGTTFVRAGVTLGGFTCPAVGWRTGLKGAPLETSFDSLLADAAVAKGEEADSAANPGAP